MIGELLVSLTDTESEISYYMGRRYTRDPITKKSGYSPVLAFDLTNELVVKAIRERDEIIFGAFESVLGIEDRIVDLPDILHAMYNGWEHNIKGGIEEYKHLLHDLLDNPFATDSEKAQAKKQLEEIAEYEKQQQHKRIEKSAKAKFARKRRSQFEQQRPDLMLALIDRDGYECVECKSQVDLTIDHIVPLSKGGTDELENLRLLCRKCNSRKGDKSE